MNPISPSLQASHAAIGPTEFGLRAVAEPATRPSTREATGDCDEMRAISARLHRALDRAEGAPSDSFVVLQLADLRRMHTWGVTIQGQPLDRYFDLGSIDDIDQRYPVTLGEARELSRAMDGLAGHTCRTAAGKTNWKRQLV